MRARCDVMWRFQTVGVIPIELLEESELNRDLNLAASQEAMACADLVHDELISSM